LVFPYSLEYDMVTYYVNNICCFFDFLNTIWSYRHFIGYGVKPWFVTPIVESNGYWLISDRRQEFSVHLMLVSLQLEDEDYHSQLIDWLMLQLQQLKTTPD
jgi:hypothetical protein